MKRFCKKLVAIFALIFAMNALIPYSIPVAKNAFAAEAATVGLNKMNIKINVGETYQLKLLGTEGKVKWSSGNKSIANVSSNGFVIGKKIGTIIVTASIDGIEYDCTVWVVKPFIRVKGYKAGLGVQNHYIVENLPKEYTQEDVKWSSSDENIITIDDNGLATNVSLGNAKIIASFGENQLTGNVIVAASRQDIKDAVNNLKTENCDGLKNIQCVISNPSKVNLRLTYQVEFYNFENVVVSISNPSYVEILAGDEIVINMQKPDKEYNYYKIKYTSKSISIGKSYKDKVSVKTTDEYDYAYFYNDVNNKVSDTIKLFDVSVDNQSGKRVYINAYVLYYKDSKLINIVGFTSYNNMDIGESIIKNPISQNYRYQKINFPQYDSYRIIYTAKDSF